MEGELEPELVAFDGAILSIGSGVSGRNVILSKTCGIEPVLKRCNRAIVFEGPSVPHAFQGRYLVIPGSFSRLQRIAGIGADALIENVETGAMIRRGRESIHRGQLVVRVEWRRVASSAPFALEDLLAFGRAVIESIRVRRRLERVDVLRQRV